MTGIVVLGGGINGLAAALRLAQAGRRVTLIEAAAEVGGGAADHAFAPGFRAPLLANWVAGLDPRLGRAAGLAAGLAAGGTALPTLLPGAPPRRVGDADPADWAALTARLARMAAALAPLRLAPPPRLARAGNDWLHLIRSGLRLRRLGRDDLRELMRVILTNVADLAEDELADPALRGLIAHDAVQGAWLGPRSPNSLILLLNRLALGAPVWPAGGPGALVRQVAAAAQAAGAVLRAGARVARIDTAAGRVVGVTLADGSALAADQVLSTLPPQVTLRDLVGPRALDAGLYTRAGQIRARGGAARLFLALSALPDLRGADPRARIVVAPSVEAVEAAWNPVKYGEVPAAPVVEAVFPSAFAPGWAPPGHHVLAATVQFAPHDPPDRAAARAALSAAARAVLEGALPGLGAVTLQADCLMPWDLGDRLGNPGGNWHQAELSVEQMLFLRPTFDLSHHATPVAGLWLGGAGCHPGGGLTGTPGWNAAGALLGVRA